MIRFTYFKKIILMNAKRIVIKVITLWIMKLKYYIVLFVMIRLMLQVMIITYHQQLRDVRRHAILHISYFIVKNWVVQITVHII